jgi:HEAT repeat protein
LPLRDIVQSLREAEQGVPPQGRAQRRLRAQVRSMGAAALPALLRALRSENAGVVDWACDLLGSVADAQLPDLCERLDAILIDPRVQDATKARILGLLADLQAPVPTQVLLQDPDAMIRSSVRELIADLSSEQAVAQALDLLFSQVPSADLPRFLREVIRHGGASAQPFLAALIVDPRTPREVALELTQDQRPLPTTTQSLHGPKSESVASRRTAHQVPIAKDFRPALADCRRYLASLPSVPVRALSVEEAARQIDLADRCYRSLRLRHGEGLRSLRVAILAPTASP